MYMEVMDLCLWRSWACVYGGPWAEQLVIHLSQNPVQSKKLVSCAGDFFFFLVRLIRFFDSLALGSADTYIKKSGQERNVSFRRSIHFRFTQPFILRTRADLRVTCVRACVRVWGGWEVSLVSDSDLYDLKCNGRLIQNRG